MLKIRLSRKGSRHRPFYRVVVSDGRRRPTSSALEEIGFYDPRKSPSLVEINVDRVDHWVSQGAKPSETVARLVAKARRGEVADVAGEAAAETAAEAPVEAAVVEAAPVEAAAAEEVTEEAAAATTDEASDDKPADS